MDSLPYSLTQIAELTGHDERAWHVAWNPTRPLLASCSSDRTVRLYHYSTKPNQSNAQELIFQLDAALETGHTKTVRCIAWAPSGATFLTASFDSETYAWEQALGSDDDDDDDEDDDDEMERMDVDKAPVVRRGEWECAASLEGHENEVKCVSYSASGTLVATCGRDKTVYIWEVKPDSEFEIVDVKMEHTQDVKCVAWHPSEEILASGSYDDTIKLYKDDPDDDFYVFQTLHGHASTVWSLAWEPPPASSSSSSSTVTTTSFSKDNNDGDIDIDDMDVAVQKQKQASSSLLASASDDRTIRIWARGSGEGADRWRWTEACVLEGAHSRSIYSLSWAPTPPSQQRRRQRCRDRCQSEQPGKAEDTATKERKGEEREGETDKVEDEDEEERGAGWLASAGGDGRVNVWQIWERPKTKTNSNITGTQSQTQRVRAELIARLEDAHGVSEVNCVAWCPRTPDSNSDSDPDPSPGLLLATAGDDGSVRIWRIKPSSAELVTEEIGGK